MAEILKHLRTEDFTGAYKAHFEVSSELSTRDQTGFEKTFSGLMKILFPDGKISTEEAKELLSFSMEARRRVREHILRIDDTFKRNDFAFRSVADGSVSTVITPEEKQYPTFAAPPTKAAESPKQDTSAPTEEPSQLNLPAVELKNSAAPETAKTGHLIVPENTKGWSYHRLFADHLKGARQITVNDPYVRAFFQTRNLMEFLEMVHEIVPEGDEASVELVTQPDKDPASRQEENLNQIVNAFSGSRTSLANASGE